MRQREWENRTVRQIKVLHTTPCAVLVPVVEVDFEDHLVFEVRSSDLDWQPGDICFPGGSVEISDHSPKETAIRETTEELGISEGQIHLLGPLDYLESPVGVTVWPYAARLDTTAFSVSQGEVSEIFTVPISWFIHHEPELSEMEIATRPSASFPRDVEFPTPAWKKRKNYDVYIYRYGVKTIWGITAHIVKNFVEEYERIEKHHY